MTSRGGGKEETSTASAAAATNRHKAAVNQKIAARIDAIMEETTQKMEQSPHNFKDADANSYASCSTDDIGDLTTMEDSQGKAANTLARKEERAVWILRFMVLLVLAIVATAVCLFVYFGARQTEVEDFEDDFQDLSDKLVESFEATFNDRMEVMRDMAEDYTSYAKDANQTWPFVTLPDVEYRARRTAKLAKLLFMIQVPIIEASNRQEWESYSNSVQGWRAEALAVQKGVSVEEIEPTLPLISPVITKNREYDTSDGPYYPIWQTHPALAIPIQNFNFVNEERYANAVNTVVTTRRPVFPTTSDHWNVPVDDSRRTVLNAFLAAYGETDTYDGSAYSSLYYPIMDELDGTGTVKSFLIFNIYWKTYFSDILPAGVKGVIAVMENSCGQSYTYRIDGTEATFLGNAIQISSPSLTIVSPLFALLTILSFHV